MSGKPACHAVAAKPVARVTYPVGIASNATSLTPTDQGHLPPPAKIPEPSASIGPSSTSIQSSFISLPLTWSNTEPAPPNNDAYFSDQTASASDSPHLRETVGNSQSEWDEINAMIGAMEQTLGSLVSLFNICSARKMTNRQSSERKDSTRSEGVYRSNVLKTGTVHLGSRSALVDILDKSKRSEDTVRALPHEDLLARFSQVTSNVNGTFCRDRCCIAVLTGDFYRFLNFYRQIGAVLYPVLADLDELE